MKAVGRCKKARRQANGVKQLASIPSKEVLLAQLCGLLMSPVSRTAGVRGALAAKKGEGEAAAA